jgi:hypothetical protein
MDVFEQIKKKEKENKKRFKEFALGTFPELKNYSYYIKDGSFTCDSDGWTEGYTTFDLIFELDDIPLLPTGIDPELLSKSDVAQLLGLIAKQELLKKDAFLNTINKFSKWSTYSTFEHKDVVDHNVLIAYRMDI